ncbi:MAG: hypothetical protein VB108_08220 [Anaerolineaceae bacterium]|nr:hypothetical protein [Anaerolineaceae bacterium]
MKKKGWWIGLFGVILALITVLMGIPTTRESIINWKGDISPLLLTSNEFKDSTLNIILTDDDVRKEQIEDVYNNHQTYINPIQNIGLKVRNQSARSNQQILFSVPVKVVEYTPYKNSNPNILYVPKWLRPPVGGYFEIPYLFYIHVKPQENIQQNSFFIEDQNKFWKEIGYFTIDKSQNKDLSYSLGPGEFVDLTIFLHFSQAGNYKVQVGLNIITERGEAQTIWLDQKYWVSVPEEINIWHISEETHNSPYKILFSKSCIYSGIIKSELYDEKGYSCNFSLFGTK